MDSKYDPGNIDNIFTNKLIESIRRIWNIRSPEKKGRTRKCRSKYTYWYLSSLKTKGQRIMEWTSKIELRYLLKSIQTKLTSIAVDEQLSLMIEEKDSEDAIGLATYSNSESTVLFITSIFENLWLQSTID
jgi:hypothetical protein